MATKLPLPQQQMGGGGDSFTSQIAGMSKNQLYEIMSQMKVLIEQNQQQARRILIDNPLLTKALFQAQIMLGMVQPPQAMPNIQQTLSQHPQQPSQPGQQQNSQASQSLPGQTGFQGQAVSSQTQVPLRQQLQTQPPISMPSLSVPSLLFQSQTMPPHHMQSVLQAKGPLNSQVSLPQSSQIHNLPPPPLASQLSILQTPMPMVSSQMQQPLQTSGILLPPLQPPLPQQPRPPSMQPFPHQLHQQMPPFLGFQPSSMHQQLPSQPMFHPGANPPTSFPQGQPPPIQLYQGGSHLTADFSYQAGSSMQVDRGSPWGPGLPDKAASGAQLPGPPPMVSGQMGSGVGGQQPHQPHLTPEMEKQLLQQVMSLTPEQINLLPPEQRNQVLQLQQMLR